MESKPDSLIGAIYAFTASNGLSGIGSASPISAINPTPLLSCSLRISIRTLSLSLELDFACSGEQDVAAKDWRIVALDDDLA